MNDMKLWLTEELLINLVSARLDSMHGMNIIVPDFILPKFNLEPFTMYELRAIYNYKRANTSKLRSIIRKAKHNI